MKKILLIVLVPCFMIAMDKPAAQMKQHADRIVDEVSALRKPKEKKIVSELLSLSPAKKLEIDAAVFSKVKQVCSYEYVPLMKALLDKRIINVNCYSLWGESGQYKQTLFTQAIAYARENNELGMVRLLLDKGANPSVKSVLLLGDPTPPRPDQDNKEDFISPLSRIAHSCREVDMFLIYLLVQNGADINTLEQGWTCFMRQLNNYIGNRAFASAGQNPKQYELIRKLLSCGADIHVPSKSTKGTLTPLQLAIATDQKELVALFEEHQKKGK